MYFMVLTHLSMEVEGLNAVQTEQLGYRSGIYIELLLYRIVMRIREGSQGGIRLCPAFRTWVPLTRCGMRGWSWRWGIWALTHIVDLVYSYLCCRGFRIKVQDVKFLKRAGGVSQRSTLGSELKNRAWVVVLPLNPILGTKAIGLENNILLYACVLW